MLLKNICIKPNRSCKMLNVCHKNELNQKTYPFYGRSTSLYYQTADVENSEQKRIELFKCITHKHTTKQTYL